MSDLQCLRQVELLLAMPVLLAGVRTGAVYSIGLVTISAIVGAGGLGVYITAGMSRGDVLLTLLGVVPILAITTSVPRLERAAGRSRSPMSVYWSAAC